MLHRCGCSCVIQHDMTCRKVAMQDMFLQVLSHGSFTGEHPVNRKAKCTVYLRDLQQQTGLTDEALQLIARVCGPRSVCNVHDWVSV